MIEKIKTATVLYMNGVAVALFNLKAVLYGKINHVCVKDLFHLLLGKRHGP
ncbi:hypothetical protein SDC9_152131 [bioreactor metagenome]|uniref:Uncharacterized protein n=1 Tax=bioreactor metagenome TaxID=1076179 RepID=A0A645EWK6_9ZZZZ